MTCKSRTLEEIISQFGEIPLCQCDECQKNGTKINVVPDKSGSYSRYRNGYSKFLPGHSNKGEGNSMRGKKRPEHSELMKGSGNPMFGNPREDLKIKFKGEGNPMFGKEAWNKDKPWSDEVKEKLKYPKTQDHKDKLSKVRIGRFKGEDNVMSDPEVKKNHLESVNTIEYKENMSISINEMWKRPDIKEKLSNSLKEMWKDPEQREKRLKSTPRGKDHPFYGKQTPHGHKIYPHITPFQGLILMHHWEHLLAEYYDKNNIKYYYEPITYEMSILGKQTTYTPDFYIPEFNEFIEVKGYWRNNSRLKSIIFEEELPFPFKYNILYNKDLQNLGINLRGI